jgi:hypothetical protein
MKKVVVDLNKPLTEYAKKLIRLTMDEKIVIPDDKETKKDQDDKNFVINNEKDLKEKILSTDSSLPGDKDNIILIFGCILILILMMGLVLFISMTFYIGKDLYNTIKETPYSFHLTVFALIKSMNNALWLTVAYTVINATVLSVVYGIARLCETIYYSVKTKRLNRDINNNYDKIRERLKAMDEQEKKNSQKSESIREIDG